MVKAKSVCVIPSPTCKTIADFHGGQVYLHYPCASACLTLVPSVLVATSAIINQSNGVSRDEWKEKKVYLKVACFLTTRKQLKL